MSGDIQLGIRLTYDGKEVTGGVLVNREDFKKLAKDASDAGNAITNSYSSAAKGVRSISEQLARAQVVVASVFSIEKVASFSAQVLESAQAVTTLNARLRVTTSSQAEFATAQAGVFNLAQRWGQSLGETGNAFARLNPAIEQMGGKASTTLRILDALNASMRLSGATTQESSAVMLQFSQAMGSGVVQGDEFRSLMEGAQPLMREVAAVLGKTTGELKKLGSEGKLTAEVFGNAVLKASDRLKAMAEGVPPTFAAAAEAVKNSALLISNAFVDGLKGGNGTGTALADLAQGLANSTSEAAALGAAIRSTLMPLAEVAAAYALIKTSARLGPMISEGYDAARAAAAQAIAAQQAAVANRDAAAAEVARLTALKANAQADLERATAQRAASAATLNATAAIGVQSAALAAKRDASNEAKASILLMAEASRTLGGIETQLATATRNHAEATAAASVAVRAKAGAMNVLNTALGAFGGPIGLAITATVGFAAWLITSRQEAAALETQLWKTKRAKDDLAAGKAPQTGDIQATAAEAQKWRDILDKMQQQGEKSFSLGPRRGRLSRDEVSARIQELQGQVDAGQKALADAAKAKVDAEAKINLSDPGALAKLTADAKWSAKLAADYEKAKTDLESARKSALRVAKTDAARTQVEQMYQGGLAEALQKYKQGMENLPGVKEGRATSLARLKADLDQEKDLFEERNRTVDALEKQGTLSAEAAINAKAAARDVYLAAEAKGAQEEERIAKRSADTAGVVAARAKRQQIDAQRAASERLRQQDIATNQTNARAEADKLVDKATLANWQRADALAFEASLIGKTAQEQAVLNKQREIDLDLERALLELKSDDKLKNNPAAQAEVERRLREAADVAKRVVTDNAALIQARNDDWTVGATASLNKYLEAARNVASQTEQLFDRAFSSMEDALVNFVKTGKLDFRSLADSIMSDLIRMQIRASATQMMGAAGGGAGVLSTITGWLGLGGGSSYNAASAAGGMTESADSLDLLKLFGYAKGDVFTSPSLHAHANTVLTQPTPFFFAKGAAFGVGGEAGPEGVMPLRRTRDGSLGVIAAGMGGGVVVNVIESPGNGGQVRQRQADGKNVIEVLVERVKASMADDVVQGNGVFPGSMERTYGLNRTAGAY